MARLGMCARATTYKNCSKQDPLDPPRTGLGRDSEFTGFIGNGEWDFEAYWAENKFPKGSMKELEQHQQAHAI
jgi:hypothetical protein